MASLPPPSPAEKRWRARNPELAARFDKLPAGARSNIRTNLFGAGTAKLVRSADAVRREAVRERSRARRAYAKAQGASLEARRAAVFAKIVSFYGLSPEKQQNLAHNLSQADPLALRRMEEADVDTMRRLVAAQLPDGATNVFHYNTRRP